MIRLLAGDCRDVLATLAAESVHTVVTSPPYYGLRDYGTALWDGGDAGCKHLGQPMRTNNKPSDAAASFHGGTSRANEFYRDTCGKCGAVRVDRQIGLEATPDEYLATMVGVFREVRRVLRRDGTCWVNMGDSYSTGAFTRQGKQRNVGQVPNGWQGPGRRPRSEDAAADERNFEGTGIKPKDLLLMPARLALALQADGWWVRSDIIWHKPNPMPESVTDRCVSAHEHVFMLTKSARYYFDAAAIAEPADSFGRQHTTGIQPPKVRALQDDGTHGRGGDLSVNYERATRACRNVWTLSTESFSGAHFATFPSALAERCIKAGTSERGCCAACGKPWARVSEYGKAVPLTPSDAGRKATWTIGDAARDPDSRTDTPLPRHYRPVVSTGWSAGCQCGTTETRPCVVLDPFIGAGTTALVADRLQRDCIGIDLNTQYTRMAMDRCIADAPLFTAFPPAEDPEDERQKELFLEPEYGA